MKYQFKTSATMKPYNRKNWWIDSDIVRDITVEADSLENALDRYREIVYDNHYIHISANALRNKDAMYRDNVNGEPEQVGYVITGLTEFDNDHRGWVKQYIDLWVSVSIVSSPFAEV
jgi:hypothetical protein